MTAIVRQSGAAAAGCAIPNAAMTRIASEALRNDEGFCVECRDNHDCREGEILL